MVHMLRVPRSAFRNGSAGLRWPLPTPGAPRAGCVTLGQSLTLCVLRKRSVVLPSWGRVGRLVSVKAAISQHTMCFSA